MRLIDADALIEDVDGDLTDSIAEGRAIEKIMNAPTIEPEQRWIPCSERLPDEDLWAGSGKQYSSNVLMTVVNTIEEETIIDFGNTVEGEWYSETTDCFIPHRWKVLAWMPLPEPYKEEGGK